MKGLYDDAYFERLDTEQLNNLVDLGLGLSPEENKTALVRILAELEKREAEEPPVDLEAAWQEFQTYYNIPEGRGAELYETGELPAEAGKKTPAVRTSWFRGVGRAAAVAAVTAVLMVTTAVAAQTAGYDVFGALGRWSDEAFWFELTDDEQREAEYARHQEDFQRALGSIGVTQDLIPRWMPSGCTPNSLNISRNEAAYDSVWCEYNNWRKEEVGYSVLVSHYYDAGLIGDITFEKDGKDVKTYKSRDKVFYILSNGATSTATWSDGEVVLSIAGNLSMGQMEKIIDSIGG